MVVLYSYREDQCTYIHTHIHFSLIQHSSIDTMNDCTIVDIQDTLKINTFKFQINKLLRQGKAVAVLN
jgi:hypothetical protein